MQGEGHPEGSMGSSAKTVKGVMLGVMFESEIGDAGPPVQGACGVSTRQGPGTPLLAPWVTLDDYLSWCPS